MEATTRGSAAADKTCHQRAGLRLVYEICAFPPTAPPLSFDPTRTSYGCRRSPLAQSHTPGGPKRTLQIPFPHHLSWAHGHGSCQAVSARKRLTDRPQLRDAAASGRAPCTEIRGRARGRSSTDRRGAFAAARSHSSASRVGSRSVGSDSKSELARGRDLEVTANRIEVTAKWWANHARSCEGSTLSCPTGQRSSLCRPISVPARTSLRSM